MGTFHGMHSERKRVRRITAMLLLTSFFSCVCGESSTISKGRQQRKFAAGGTRDRSYSRRWRRAIGTRGAENTNLWVVPTFRLDTDEHGRQCAIFHRSVFQNAPQISKNAKSSTGGKMLSRIPMLSTFRLTRTMMAQSSCVIPLAAHCESRARWVRWHNWGHLQNERRKKSEDRAARRDGGPATREYAIR